MSAAIEVSDRVHRGLSLRAVDEAHMLIYKSKGITDLIRAVGEGNVQPTDDAIPAGCWAINDMLDELKSLIDTGKVK